MSTIEAPRKAVAHPVDEVLPVPKLAIYGFQHVLAFYAGAVIVPILLANSIGLNTEQLIHLINADLFTCGIASIIQSVGFWKIGVRLPLLQGVTFTAVSPMIAIGLAAGGGTEGLLVIYGSVIVAGLFTFLIAPFFSKLIRFFPPVVTGSVITIIGIALLPVAAADAAGGAGPTFDPTNGRNMAYALGTLALIVLIQRVFRGFMATVAVLVGLVVGTLVAWAFGDAHFESVAQSAWVGVTTPFYFGAPKFAIAAIVSMIVVMLITAVETTGDVFATGEIVEKRITRDDIARALRADGLATTLGGILNSFPYTCFAENVGLVRLTRIKSRYVVAAAGVIMIIIGLIPKAGAIVAGIPHPVLGGAAIAMFATVAVVGIQTLSRVDFHDHRNIVIVATSIGLAMYVTAIPEVAKAVPEWAQIILGSGITLGSITAILLNLVFHHIGRGRGPAVAGAPGDHLVRLEQVNKMSEDEFVGTLRGPVPGTGLGGPPRLRAAPLLRHPGPAPRVPGSAVRRHRRGAGAADQLLPGPGCARGRCLARRPVDARAAPPRREGARGAGLADRGLPRPVRLPARHGRARPHLVRPRAHRWLGAAEQLADTGARHRVDRDRQDRDAPVRRTGRQREPDPLRPYQTLGIMSELHFNDLPTAAATERLLTCLAVPRWAAEVAAGRPYDNLAALTKQAEAAATTLTDDELAAALARHPRIGERAGADHDAAFSRREQAAVAPDDELTEGNKEYERRFGRVFLIRAAGRTAPEVLAELRRRLENDEATERAETVAQLREIALLRLPEVVGA